MGFKVTYQRDDRGFSPAAGDFGDHAVYEFLAGGILKIVPPEDDAKASYYPPTVWKSIVADQNHRPSRTIRRP
jgi:hypothetical protein